MNAIISLGGCSASFISPDGLIATNNHCVQGSLQYNSRYNGPATHGRSPIPSLVWDGPPGHRLPLL